MAEFNAVVCKCKLATQKWLNELTWDDDTTSARSFGRNDWPGIIYAIDLFDVNTSNVSCHSPFASLKYLKQPIPYVNINYEENTAEAFDSIGIDNVMDNDGEEWTVDVPVNTIWGPCSLIRN